MSIVRTGPGGRLRLGSVLAAAVALVTAIAGCGSSSSGSSSGASSSGGGSSSGGTTTITLTDYYAGGHGMAPLISAFEKANPNIKVQEQYVEPTSYSPGLRTALLAGNAADVFATNGGTGEGNSVQDLGKAGDLVDLSNQPAAVATISPSARSLYWSGNKLYGQMMGAGVDGIIYNADLFKQLNLQIPTTFPQLLALCGKIKAAGKVPISLAGMNATFSLLEPAGNTVYGRQPTWNQMRTQNQVKFASSPGWQEAMNEFLQMNKAGCFQPGAAGASISASTALIGANKAVMWMAPPVAIGAVKGINPNFHPGIFPFPGPTAADTRAMIDVSPSLSINAHSKHIQEAEKFLQFLSQPANDRQWAQLNGTVSVKDEENANLPSNESAFVPLIKAKKTVVLPYLTWQGTVFNDVLPKGLEGVVSGNTSPSALLQQMDSGW